MFVNDKESTSWKNQVCTVIHVHNYEARRFDAISLSVFSTGNRRQFCVFHYKIYSIYASVETNSYTMVAKTSESQLEQRIQSVKFTIFCLNAVIWLLGSALFGLCMWLRLDPSFQEWVDFLEIYEFYIGIYILLAVSIFIIVTTFVGCGVALMEHILGIYVYAGLQLFSYILGLSGTAVLLDYSTYDSKIQPLIRRSMTALINNYHDERTTYILQLIQESIGCCGADGPMDYLTLRKPLPTECRNSVTGNAFFHGCVEEVSWFLEGRSGWLAGLALALCMLHIIIAALSLTLARAIQKEEQSITFKH